MIDTFNEIADDKLEVGMVVGVVNGKVIERGEIISIGGCGDKFVRVRHDNKSVSAYQLGYFKFVELA